MKLRIKRAKALLVKQRPCIIFELNKYDYDRAQTYNGKDLDGYTVEVVKQKRSNDQNRYMWELISQIAEHTGVSQNEVYRQAIREAGAYFDVSVSRDAYDDFRKKWQSKGLGWSVELIGQDSQDILCRAYCGSSGYNSKEMSTLIDWVVEEARWHNIETDTPEQLAKRKAEWNG